MADIMTVPVATIADLNYEVPKRRGIAWRFVTTHPLGAAGLFVIVVMILAGVFADYVAPKGCVVTKRQAMPRRLGTL